MRVRMGLAAVLAVLFVLAFRDFGGVTAQEAEKDDVQAKDALNAGADERPSAEAQAKAFKYVNTETAELGAKQQKIFDQLKNEKTSAAVEIVRFDPSVFDRETLSLNLSNGKAVTAEKLKRTARGEQGFTWSGGTGDAAPIAHFSVRNANGTGVFKVGDATYNLRPLGNGLHALVRRTPPKPEEEEPVEAMKKIQSEAERKEAPRFNPAAEAPTSSTVTVMVLYTPDVADNHPDVGDFIERVIDITNATYQLSNVPITLELVDQRQTNYTESGDVAEDVDRIRGKTDGEMDDVHAIRDAKKADLVMLLIDHADAFGMAAAILANESTAFAAVDDEVADWYFTFAHEAGHLFGCRHNPEADPTSAPFPYGHCFCNSAKQWRTIMSYDCTGQSERIGLWSSPLLKHPAGSGDPAGTVDLHDNCRVLRQTGPIVAAFR